MHEDMKMSLQQKFNLKGNIDIGIFVIVVLLFSAISYYSSVNSYVCLLFIIISLVIFSISHILTRQWILKCIRQSAIVQSDSLSSITNDIIDALKEQKNNFDDFVNKQKNLSNCIEKLKGIAVNILSTSKNTEKQVNLSINCSQKEHDAISVNIEKMYVLRQKIQMIAELILELSEHSQQIGNTINIVDDIAEQTNMLALNAAVEAARAGEHGKGFAVVAGEIRKLADESKQAITKITSLTNSIQFTTNSTVMATEEGSKEIEVVVKEISQLSTNSESLHSLIEDVLASLDVLNQNSLKQNDIIEKLNAIDDENKSISNNLQRLMIENTDKISLLANFAKEIKISTLEG